MRTKRVFAVLAVGVVGILAIAAWVVVTAPPAAPVWASASAGPSTQQIYAANRGEPPRGTAVSAAPGPSPQQIYAYLQGQVPARAAKAAPSCAEPTTMEFYAANGGVLD